MSERWPLIAPLPNPTRDQEWFRVTHLFEHEREEALKRFLSGYGKWRTPEDERRAKDAVGAALASYRERVLAAFWKLCVPLRPGECVPNRVAELLAEKYG